MGEKGDKRDKKVSSVNTIASSEDKNFSYIPDLNQIEYNADASFRYICSNNTIFGTQYKTFPTPDSVPLVADMSSDILSKRLTISDFGLIFAGAQKNLGPSGVTIVIVRKDLIKDVAPEVPSMLSYKTHVDADSMYNTPPTLAIYYVGLVLKWLQDQGGLESIEKEIKKNRIYSIITSIILIIITVQQKLIHDLR